MEQTPLEAALESGLQSAGYTLANRFYIDDLMLAAQIDDVKGAIKDRSPDNEFSTMSDEDKMPHSFLQLLSPDFSEEQKKVYLGANEFFIRRAVTPDFLIAHRLFARQDGYVDKSDADQIITHKRYLEYISIGINTRMIAPSSELYYGNQFSSSNEELVDIDVWPGESNHIQVWPEENTDEWMTHGYRILELKDRLHDQKNKPETIVNAVLDFIKNE